MFSHDLLEVILSCLDSRFFTDVLIAYAYIMQLYPFIRAREGVLRAHAHKLAQHMHMKIETYAHAHTGGRDT